MTALPFSMVYFSSVLKYLLISKADLSKHLVIGAIRSLISLSNTGLNGMTDRNDLTCFIGNGWVIDTPGQ